MEADKDKKLDEPKNESEVVGDRLPQQPEDITTEAAKPETAVEEEKDLTGKAARADEYLDRLQRLQAEFSNYKKRIEKERAELSLFIKSELIRNFLPIIDDFERLLDNSQHEVADIRTGAELIYKKLMNMLKQEGLEPIESVGQDFDPNLHEALSVELNGEHDSPLKVVEEWEKGYLFNSKLLRPAKVKVSSVETKASNE